MYKYKLREALPDVEYFQSQRIKAFDNIIGRLENVKKKLKIAQLDTIKYYRENPDTYSVLYATDMINDYLDDIEKLLSEE